MTIIFTYQGEFWENSVSYIRRGKMKTYHRAEISAYSWKRLSLLAEANGATYLNNIQWGTF